MADHTDRVTETVGTSPESVETAIRNGLQRAGQTLRHLDSGSRRPSARTARLIGRRLGMILRAVT